jgi:hypothetical protein
MDGSVALARGRRRQSLLANSLSRPGPSLFFFSHLNPRGVVLRTRPSYYPRGTCPRWADTPAAPGGAESLSRQFLALVVIGEMFILKSPGPFLALPFPHLNPRGVVLRTRPSYYPRGTCPRWADTPAAPGRAESLSRQFLALVEFVEMVRLPCQVGHLRCLVGHLHCHVGTLRCRMGRVRLRCQWLEGGSRREVLSGQPRRRFGRGRPQGF